MCVRARRFCWGRTMRRPCGLGTMASSASGRVVPDRISGLVPTAAPLAPRARYSRPMSERADVVVIGGGLFGTSIAYQLCRWGAGRVILLERDTLGSGRLRPHVRHGSPPLLQRGHRAARHARLAHDHQLGRRGRHRRFRLRRDGLPAAGARGARGRLPRQRRAARGARARHVLRRRRARSRRSSRCSRSTASPVARTSPTAVSPTRTR